MTDLHGTIDDRFEPLARILQQQLENGYDLGASLAVAVDGEVVTDCWGGWADEAKKAGWYRYIRVEAERLSRLIANVLTLARMTRGQDTLELRTQPLGAGRKTLRHRSVTRDLSVV